MSSTTDSNTVSDKNAIISKLILLSTTIFAYLFIGAAYILEIHSNVPNDFIQKTDLSIAVSIIMYHLNIILIWASLFIVFKWNPIEILGSKYFLEMLRVSVSVSLNGFAFMILLVVIRFPSVNKHQEAVYIIYLLGTIVLIQASLLIYAIFKEVSRRAAQNAIELTALNLSKHNNDISELERNTISPVLVEV